MNGVTNSISVKTSKLIFVEESDFKFVFMINFAVSVSWV